MGHALDSDEDASTSEIRHVVDSILDEKEGVNPVVEVEDNKFLFKSTLVSQLNGNPTLSKDRLTRVRQGVYYAKEEKECMETNENLFGIGSDCAVFFHEQIVQGKITRSCKPSSSGGKKKAKSVWYLGRVQKMRRMVSGACVSEDLVFQIGHQGWRFNLVGIRKQKELGASRMT